MLVCSSRLTSGAITIGTRSVMTSVISWLEAIVSTIPLPLLEVWSRFSYIVGLVLAICAFGGFTFRIGERWGFGRERQAWDAKAFLCIPLTFVLIIATGYIGSFVVLGTGAQTFESLKDLVVFLCVVLFGYPALITVPFAYGLSDLIEGVPPGFLLDWLPGYFIRPAYFWIAYQLIGRRPDFRLVSTWGKYGLFVVTVLMLEPVLWGYVCSDKFTSAISYRSHHPSIAPDHAITWIIAPVGMLFALPLARRFGCSGRKSPDTSESARLGAATGSGKQAAAHAGRRGPGAGRPADPGLHLHAVHRTGARDGRRHGDCCTAERGR